MQLSSDISLASFNGMTLDGVRNAYREIRALAVASLKSLPTNEAFDKFVETRAVPHNNGRRLHDAKNWLLSATSVFIANTAVRHAIPPSEETLSWGGFLGGEIHHDFTDADAAIAAILRKNGAN